MSDLPQPDVNAVRRMLREHDESAENDAPPQLEPGVSTTRIDPDGGERFQPLRRELGVSTFGLNLIRLRPGERGRIHRHERQEEVYLVYEGALTLGVEGEERVLERGELARVAPGERRQLTNAGDQLLLLVALGGAELHEGRDGQAFTAWDDHEGARPQDVPIPPDLER
jgi:quercetin dioxygenase-like cupin family protein